MTGCTCIECSRMRAHTDLIRRRLRALERPAYFTSTDAPPAEARLPDGGRRTAVEGTALQVDWMI